MAKWATGEPPKKEGKYIVTLVTGFGNRQVRQAVRSEYPEGNWTWKILPEYSTATSEVVAWQKQPEPYKGE